MGEITDRFTSTANASSKVIYHQDVEVSNRSESPFLIANEWLIRILAVGRIPRNLLLNFAVFPEVRAINYKTEIWFPFPRNKLTRDICYFTCFVEKKMQTRDFT